MAGADDLDETFDSLGNISSVMESLEAAIGSLESTIAELSDSLGSVGKGLQDTSDSSAQTSDSFKKITDAGHAAAGVIKDLGSAFLTIANGQMPSATEAMTAVGNAIGGVVSGMGEKLNSALSSAGDALEQSGGEAAALGAALKVVGAAAQAAAEVLGATVGVVGELMGISIEANEKLDMMSARFGALAGSAAGGAAITAMVQKLSTQLPFATEQIAQWTSALQRAGLSGKGLEEATKAVAAAAALNPAGGAEAAQNLIAKIAEGGAGATKILKQLQEGGPKTNKMLADMGLSTADIAKAMGMTEAQFKKAHLSAEKMNTAIIKALEKKGQGPLGEMMSSFPVILQKAKEGFMSLFEGLGPAIKPFMAAVKALFAEFNRGGGATKALKPIIVGVLKEAFAIGTKLVGIIKQVVLGFMGAKQAHGPWAAVGQVLHMVASAAWTVLGALVSIGGGIASVIGSIVTFVAQVITTLANLGPGAVSAAGDFISGLVQGIASGGVAVTDAIKNLASSALASFKAAMGIASPSTIMLEHGEENIAGAAATGIDKGSAKVDTAMEGLVGKPGKGGGKGAGRAGGKGATFQFNNCTFGGSSEAEVHAWMDSWWEKQAAAGPEAEPTS